MNRRVAVLIFFFFQNAVFRAPERLLPALARCLRAAGKPLKAEIQLRNLIDRRCPSREEAWDLWQAIFIADLKRPPEEVFPVVPYRPLFAAPCA